MHGMPISKRKIAEEFAQTLTYRLQELLFFGSGSGLGRTRLRKEYLRPALTVLYLAS